MAWNEKGLKQLNRNPTRKIDDFDRQAESEGNARRFFNGNDLRPQLGRRISKESRKAEGLAKTAERKATINLVKDTAEVARRIMVLQLAQR